MPKRADIGELYTYRGVLNPDNGLNNRDARGALRNHEHGYDFVATDAADIGLPESSEALPTAKGSWRIWHKRRIRANNVFLPGRDDHFFASVGAGLYIPEGSATANHLLLRIDRGAGFDKEQFETAAGAVAEHVIERPVTVLRNMAIGVSVGATSLGGLGALTGEPAVMSVGVGLGGGLSIVGVGWWELYSEGKAAGKIPEAAEYRVDDVARDELQKLSRQINRTVTLLELADRLKNNSELKLGELANLIENDADMNAAAAKRLEERRSDRVLGARFSRPDGALEAMVKIALINEHISATQRAGRAESNEVIRQLGAV